MTTIRIPSVDFALSPFRGKDEEPIKARYLDWARYLYCSIAFGSNGVLHGTNIPSLEALVSFLISYYPTDDSLCDLVECQNMNLSSLAHLE